MSGHLAAALEVTDLSWRQLVRSKQLIGIGLAILFAAGIAWTIHQQDRSATAAAHFQALQAILLSTVIVPLIALLLGTGAMASERESGTLAYLFTRPIPRYVVVLAKGIGAIVGANVAVVVCVLVVFLASGAPARGELVGGVGALMLETTALTALFVLFGTLMSRSLYAGLAYVALFEGLLGNTVGAKSGWSVTYHARNLLSEWSGSASDDLFGTLPGSAAQSALVLLAVAGLSLVAAAAWVETREYGLRDRAKED
ncbi:MAG TPA: ABC transporter permease subunit [Candidatus Thermoplasmatota archaeon]|nr:ABC transporter permease subunit [Candidatus Thermoplasmatota archaeon]